MNALHLIDAWVMENYFHDIAALQPAAYARHQSEFLTHLQKTLNAPSRPIRNQYHRLTADSPELTSINQGEGNV